MIQEHNTDQTLKKEEIKMMNIRKNIFLIALGRVKAPAVVSPLYLSGRPRSLGQKCEILYILK